MLKIFKDPQLHNLLGNCCPPKWGHRLLFHSHVGAKEWLDLGRAKGYPGAETREEALENDPVVTIYGE